MFNVSNTSIKLPESTQHNQNVLGRTSVTLSLGSTHDPSTDSTSHTLCCLNNDARFRQTSQYTKQ